LKISKKARFKKICWYWLLIDLAIAAILLVLLLYKPARYDPPQIVDDGQVSLYLTHELLPQFYNGAQRQEPFDVVVSQEGINDVVARSGWPMESIGVMFSTPVVFFVPKSIMLMGVANVKGVELVVTIVLEPAIDEQGLLNLWVAKVKVGAMNVTLLARVIAKRMFSQILAETEADPGDIRTQIVASLLNEEPFDPVFPVEDKKVRVKKITITQEKLTMHLVPVFD